MDTQLKKAYWTKFLSAALDRLNCMKKNGIYPPLREFGNYEIHLDRLLSIGQFS